MRLYCLEHPFAYEMECILRLFYPGEKIAVRTVAEPDNREDTVTTRMTRAGDNAELYVCVRFGGELREASERIPAGGENWEWRAEARMGALMFGLLCERTGMRPPWGILTGVRPVALCRKLLERLGSEHAVFEELTGEYLARPQKAELALATLRTQRPILQSDTPDSFSLYVSIPFCPTRCLYCSFVSHAIDRAAKLIPEYLTLLSRELEEVAALARREGYALRTVYIGGGTPTILAPEQLRGLLDTIARCFDLSGLREYTVEAGRPDSVTREKLAVLREFGVGRISINPQAMDDTILRKIGRAHTTEQVIQAMALAREAGFEAVNMDLIAGLPGQEPRGFEDSLEKVLALSPENITVHTLTVKRSSELRWREDAFDENPYALDELLAISQNMLKDGGYLPYYLYRQQSTRQNLENTGFSLPGREGLYNVYSMEDRHTILGAGAGAVTKLYAPPNRIKRVFNYKYPYEYIKGFGELMRRKQVAEGFRSGQ